MPALRTYNQYRGIETLGPVWSLTKGERTVTCTLYTHPLGWDLVVRMDGELFQSQVCKTETSTLDSAAALRAAWESKGWTD